MKRILTIILVLCIWYISANVLNSYAATTIPGASIISTPSIQIPLSTTGDSIASAKDFGFRILWVIKTVISGFALIYLIMIGVYMILGSDNEETVKTQRKQIVYALIGFIFLNIPGFVYTIFMHDSWGTFETATDPTLTSGGSVLWNTQFDGILGEIIAFLRVFAFGVAVTMFTWGLFNLIMSAGDDEKKKKAKNRIVYGIIGLIFLGFVEMWGLLIAMGNFSKIIPVGNTLFSLVMYFSAPIAIFMLMWWAYYFITSAGDEERMKKWKSIVINTGIALIILLSALSFITDLSKFQL